MVISYDFRMGIVCFKSISSLFGWKHMEKHPFSSEEGANRELEWDLGGGHGKRVQNQKKLDFLKVSKTRSDMCCCYFWIVLWPLDVIVECD